MNAKLKASLRYTLLDYSKGAAIFLGVIAGIMLVFSTAVVWKAGDSVTNISMGGFSASIFLFVLGIVGAREKQRLLNQFGVSRKTAYEAELISMAAVSVGVAAALELLTGIFQQLFAARPNFFVGDLYQLIYFNGFATSRMTLGQHAAALWFNAGLMLALGVFGQFFSLLFWRLSRKWTVAVGIAIPVLCNGIPWAIYSWAPGVGRWLGLVVNFWAASSWNVVLSCLLFAAAGIGVNWLLLRRANLRSAK